VLPFCPSWADAHVARVGPASAIQRGTSAIPVVWPQGVIARVDPGALVTHHAALSRAPYLALTLGMALEVRRSRLSRVVGYGAGDVATAFMSAARMVGLDVVSLVDSNPATHGTTAAGVGVIGLDEAVALGVHAYVVLSVAHATAISNAIRTRYRSEPTLPLIFDVTTTLSR
jgi:FlaA1/EpsC-like NDP-sugar epimerase